MKCGCVFVSGQRLSVPPSGLSWSVNLAQCRHVTHSSDQQHIVSMEDVFFIIVQIFLSLSIVAGIHYTGCLSATPPKNKAISNVSFPFDDILL